MSLRSILDLINFLIETFLDLSANVRQMMGNVGYLFFWRNSPLNARFCEQAVILTSTCRQTNMNDRLATLGFSKPDQTGEFCICMMHQYKL